MTDRSSEERSRFEKWWGQQSLLGVEREPLAPLIYKNPFAQAAWDGWRNRAALEDRQEAAPEKLRKMQPDDYWLA